MAEQSKRVPFWRSLQTKFALTYVVIIAAVLILLNTYPVLVSQDLVYQSKQASLQNQAAVLASALSMGPEELTRETVKGTIDRLGVPGTTRVVVTDPAGEVLCDWYEGAYQEDTLGRYALFWEVAAALQGNDVFRSEYREGVFRSRAAVPVTYRSMTLGAVYFYEYDTEQGALLLGIQSNLRSMSAVICVVTLIMSVFFSKALTRRIAALLRAIRIVRQGEYSHRVDLKGGDEMTQLAEEFNELTGRLQTTEEVRRRFVSDASHELRTPIAVVQGYANLLDRWGKDDPDAMQESITAIRAEADAMKELVEQLLFLARGDNDSMHIQMEAFDLTEVAAEVLRETEMIDQTHRFASHWDGAVPVFADMGLMKQCLRILVDNSIKYTPAGGLITLRSSVADGAARISVQDEGQGIDSESLPHIFERFYRTDVSRARQTGGTGLGLAIAKWIVDRHGGWFEVRSWPGVGTRMTVVLPLANLGGQSDDSQEDPGADARQSA